MERTNPPLVSVIIPTYGRNERLVEAIRSVIGQTYDNIELLIVDDGSAVPVTETLDDVDFTPLNQVTFIRHDDNRGANTARNNGIRAATGEYIAFLDDDDYWDETKVEKQVNAFEQSPEKVGVVYTGRQAKGPDGTTVTRPTAAGNVIKPLLRGETFGQFSSVMVRSTAVDTAGLLDERFPAWQDREWFLRLAKHYHFEPIGETLTYRRTDLSDRISKNFEQKRDVAYPLFVEKHYAFAREHGLYHARSFLASLRLHLARAAVHAGDYRSARKYFLLAALTNPLHRTVYPHLLASLGGKRTYEFAADLQKKLRSLPG